MSAKKTTKRPLAPTRLREALAAASASTTPPERLIGLCSLALHGLPGGTKGPPQRFALLQALVRNPAFPESQWAAAIAYGPGYVQHAEALADNPVMPLTLLTHGGRPPPAVQPPLIQATLAPLAVFAVMDRSGKRLSVLGSWAGRMAKDRAAIEKEVAGARRELRKQVTFRREHNYADHLVEAAVRRLIAILRREPSEPDGLWMNHQLALALAPHSAPWSRWWAVLFPGVSRPAPDPRAAALG